MTHNPIDLLLQEHRAIMFEVAELRAAIESLAGRGENALTDSLPAFKRFDHVMTSQVDLHRRKEDEVLFPAIEQILGEMSSPTGPMRQEHRDIHDQGKLLRETLRELNEEQHPAIEAGADNLRNLVNAGGSVAAMVSTGHEIIHLLDLHFSKEEQVLFPMARELLAPETLLMIAKKFQEMDAEQSRQPG